MSDCRGHAPDLPIASFANRETQPAIGHALAETHRRIERAGDIAPAIEAGIRSGKPNLVEVVVQAT